MAGGKLGCLVQGSDPTLPAGGGRCARLAAPSCMKAPPFRARAPSAQRSASSAPRRPPELRVLRRRLPTRTARLPSRLPGPCSASPWRLSSLGRCAGRAQHRSFGGRPPRRMLGSKRAFEQRIAAGRVASRACSRRCTIRCCRLPPPPAACRHSPSCPCVPPPPVRLSLQVISNRMQKSVLVAVDRLAKHKKYDRILKRTTKLMVRPQHASVGCGGQRSVVVWRSA